MQVQKNRENPRENKQTKQKATIFQIVHRHLDCEYHWRRKQLYTHTNTHSVR